MPAVVVGTGAPSRSNGWKRRSICSGGTVGPVFEIDTKACRSRVPVVMSTCPSGVLWRIALSIRLAISRSTQSRIAGGRRGVERGVHVEVETRELRLAREHGLGREGREVERLAALAAPPDRG